MQDPRFYDCPRVLSPTENKFDNKSSPLKSPTDTESVFTDDDTADVNVFVTKKFTRTQSGGKKETAAAPPRPPKSVHIAPLTYINLNPHSPTNIENNE